MAGNELTMTEREELEQLRKEKKLKDKAGLALKVSQKGAVSLYGLGRWPVTLYKGQWQKVLDFSDCIREFINEHEGELSVKE